MDVMRGPPAPGGHGVGPITTPPPPTPPPRPAIPPKPPKEKISLSGQKSEGVALCRSQSTVDSQTTSPPAHNNCHSAPDPTTPLRGNVRASLPPIATSPVSRSSASSPPPTSGLNNSQLSPGANKPALPPKPLCTSNPTSPSVVTGRPPLKTPSQFPTQPIDKHAQNGPSTERSPPALNGTANGNLHSPPPFLRAKPPPRDPQLSPRGFTPNQNSRPTSTTSFNFSSPIQTLSSANFPSTSNGLNQCGGCGVTSPSTRLAQIRVKSASLGRSQQPPPFSSESGGGGIRGIISRKSATLSKFLPLDLQIGSNSRISPTTKKPTNALNLNPFIIQQQMSQQQLQSPILSFGKSIAFSSPESPLPPPPPPRLRKKLSPVNSLGSPTSPTSPTSPSFPPISTTQLPMPPPISPNTLAMEALKEVGEAGPAIYAEVDKQKKWEERKLKQGITSRSSFNAYSYPKAATALTRHSSAEPHPHSSPHHHPSISSQESPNSKECNSDNLAPPELLCTDETRSSNNSVTVPPPKATVVDSWLGKYVHNNNPTVLSNNNNAQSAPERSATPTYQSTRTGHIYETIGDSANNNNNNNNNNAHGLLNNNNNEASKKAEEDENLSENQSFLFKLVIGQQKSVAEVSESKRDEGEAELKVEIIEKQDNKDVVSKEEERVNSDQDNPEPEVIPPPPPPRLHQQNSPAGECVTAQANTYLIPTVIGNVAAKVGVNEGKPGEYARSVGGPTTSLNSTPSSRTSSILRRSSWNNGDRFESPPPSSSSSVTSSNSYLPYRHRIEQSHNSPDTPKRDSLASRESWIDEGDSSNGALADAESSDAQPAQSSLEDIVHLRGGNHPELCSSSASQPNKGFNTRRSRLVNSIFGSFGKGSSSSSGSNGNKRFSGLRTSGGAGGKRGRDKPQDSSSSPKLTHQTSSVSKWGRQISESIISTTMISPQPLPKSISCDASPPPTQKSPSVQFSAQVSQTRIIYPDQDAFSEERADEGLSNNLAGESSTLCMSNLGLKDDESVSSTESLSACGSVNGSITDHEDILTELSPKEKKAFYIAREILTSERTFVDVLNLLTVEFPKTIAIANKYHGSAVISNEELNMVLGGLQNLKRVNEDLLSDLEERVSKWRESPKIADILVKKGPFLKLYATYIKDFQRNSENLDSFMKKYTLFAQTVKDFESSERCKKLALKHYMLKPVQRMPQYRLLLEDYLKTLGEDSEDYEDTVKGIAIVKDVADHANDAMRLQMNAEKLLNLQNRLPAGTIILKSDRQLMKDGELDKVCRKQLQPRFFALMNDCLLCFMYHAAAGSPKDLKLRYELPLAGMRVSLSPAEDYRNEFSVISVSRSFNLVAKSPKDRDDWMKALNGAIEDNIKKRVCTTPDLELGFQLGKEAPVWIQDKRVTMCQLCTAEFTVTFRRHHCRACGKVVCGNCSGNQAPLKYKQNESCRVCDSCYEYLLEEFDKRSSLSPTDQPRALLREKFKKVTPNVSRRATKIKRTVPSRLEVNANSSGARISGYLNWKLKEKKNWKRRWFVLIDRVLYIYAASEDIVAIKSVPLLGWEVELDDSEPAENDEEQATFRLKHLGQQPIHFQADSLATAEKWMTAMSEAVVL